MKIRHLLALLVAGVSATAPIAAADQLLYSENFERYQFGPEWSGSKTITDVPYHIFSVFSGRYASAYTQLNLAPLPPLPNGRPPLPGGGDGGSGGGGDGGGGGGGGGGGSPRQYLITVTWDLYILDSWDGNDIGGYGEDRFSLLAQGQPIFSETFANQPGVTQSAAAPTIGPIPMWWNRWNDSIYRDLSASFVYEGGDIALRWMDHGLQSMTDESWGLDNVRVSYSIIPAPVTAAVFGVLPLTALRRRRSTAC